METTTPSLIRSKKAELSQLTKLKASFLSVMDGSSVTENVVTEIEAKMSALTTEIDTLVKDCPTVSSDPVEVSSYNLMTLQTLAKKNFVIDGIIPTSFTVTAKYF